MDDLQQIGIHAALEQQVAAELGRKRRELGGLEHHGIAGEERRQRVADREQEGEVPRADDADDPVRLVFDAR